MSEMIAWLRGVLDDDEAWARETRKDYREDSADYDQAWMAGHALWLLADIAAKRAIIEETIRPFLGNEQTTGRVALTTLRLLASAYADRPGYRAEWRP